ncbi:mavicyanin-like [Populus alba x Populus x berolinensis]|nr:mavicyanin-like [Populus alba x Populus x berolinensis]
MGGMKKTLAISYLMMALCGVSMASTVYQVGDSTGWTSMGGVDYQDWAADKSFHAGDTLVFSYNMQFHNVKQVTSQDFETCNATSPTATYTSGSDAINLERLGHVYFICGFPGHYQAGQKIDISVSPITSGPSPAHWPLSSRSGALSDLYFNKLYWTLSVLALCLSQLAY